MASKPLVLVTTDVEKAGAEFGDRSLSLAWPYTLALEQAGALPVALPAVLEGSTVSDLVAFCDGVLLTGGADLQPGLYRRRLSSRLARSVKSTPDDGWRDLTELLVLREVFRQRKPLLAICRGHQLLNVALGGTLIVDLPTQRPDGLNHHRQDRGLTIAHDVRLTPGSLLHTITGTQVLGVNSTHHQAVDRVAGLLQVTATSSDGIVEGLELAAAHRTVLPFLLSVQFHPERLQDRHSAHRAIFRAFVEACVACKDRTL
ncbi:MAG: gamma-glutamyl-gamma-aminobutyrate hydrolase family protein [Verrucomicrobiota bacterium]|nr:gamma-glutamyl-gamma-aminobutyrate hydrolase family protein [Limisphaera sp.]MDW8381541.1 gamma-glutamyl-gamma-aminobutyrate hydrolase family protein [Verrucomicrobiota bacterium]